jgi:hypothetical protein
MQGVVSYCAGIFVCILSASVPALTRHILLIVMGKICGRVQNLSSRGRIAGQKSSVISLSKFILS